MPGLHPTETPNKPLSCGTLILVSDRVVDKILFIKSPVRLGVRGLCLRHKSGDACFIAGQNFVTAKITSVSHDTEFRTAEGNLGLFCHIGELETVVSLIGHFAR